jgi:glutamate-5-semialdehyde dehydrogenase
MTRKAPARKKPSPAARKKTAGSKAPRSQAAITGPRAELARLVVAAKDASRVLAAAGGAQRNRALEAIASALERRQDDILFKNGIDVEAGKSANLSSALLDRLALTPRRIQDMAKGLRDMAALPDPLGEVVEETRRPDGLVISKVRVPLGVIAMVYEARPNVTVDSAGLCLKSGNAVVLRGGKEALDTNTALAEALKDGLREAGLPEGCAQLVPFTDRELIRDLATMD